MRDLLRRLFGGDRRGVRLPPPGAQDLRARCIKCMRCVEVCPYESISLAPLSAGAAYGTPEIDPARSPCYLCMKCPEVCPTRALTSVKQTDANLGRAEVDTETCYSWNSTICNLCYARCPLKDSAIVLDELLQPVIQDACTGCGVCFHVCPSEPTRSIRLTPAKA